MTTSQVSFKRFSFQISDISQSFLYLRLFLASCFAHLLVPSPPAPVWRGELVHRVQREGLGVVAHQG